MLMYAENYVNHSQCIWIGMSDPPPWWGKEGLMAQEWTAQPPSKGLVGEWIEGVLLGLTSEQLQYTSPSIITTPAIPWALLKWSSSVGARQLNSRMHLQYRDLRVSVLAALCTEIFDNILKTSLELEAVLCLSNPMDSLTKCLKPRGVRHDEHKLLFVHDAIAVYVSLAYHVLKFLFWQFDVKYFARPS